VAVERGLQDSGLELEGGGRILVGTRMDEIGMVSNRKEGVCS
jgi:hypothetical protein